jgi:nucleoid-associated protein YgaU
MDKDAAAEQIELAEFQANLRNKLRYLGSFFSIGLIILGLYLLLNGMMALVTKPAPDTSGNDKEAAIFDTQTVSPTVANNLATLPGVDGNTKDYSSINSGIISGIETTKVSAATVDAASRSSSNSAEIRRTGHWRATNYFKGEIPAGVYEVKLGDTLWEIAEAVYGDGNSWHKILEQNKQSIGKLPDGSQALIVPGQKLVLI